MNQIAITWSPERVKQLRALHAADKLSTLEMAAKMGVTKNALIGKLSRLGLCKPENNPITNKEVQQRWRKAHPKAINKPRGKYKPRALKSKPGPTAKLKMRAGEPKPKGDVGGGCQWLHGKPTDRNFCGHDRRPSSPYCDHHHDRCYIPAPKKKKRGEVVER